MNCGGVGGLELMLPCLQCLTSLKMSIWKHNPPDSPFSHFQPSVLPRSLHVLELIELDDEGLCDCLHAFAEVGFPALKQLRIDALHFKISPHQDDGVPYWLERGQLVASDLMKLPPHLLALDKVCSTPNPGGFLAFIVCIPQVAQMLTCIEFKTWDDEAGVTTVGDITADDLAQLARLCPNITGECSVWRAS